MARTMSPNVKAMPTWVTAPLLTSLITMAPVPVKTRAKVPRNSAISFLIILIVEELSSIRLVRKSPPHARGQQVGNHSATNWYSNQGPQVVTNECVHGVTEQIKNQNAEREL